MNVTKTKYSINIRFRWLCILGIPKKDQSIDSIRCNVRSELLFAAKRARGGKQQLGAQIAQNGSDALIFLGDPQNPKPHEPDVNDVIRLCDMHNIPMATNLATAEIIILALDRGDLDWREMYK